MHDAGSAPRRDTRARVQQVALELFAEQGYEKTSLREIAERLGVTKAALYYHFKSKGEHRPQFHRELFTEIDALLDWAKDQPRNEETRREILDRYVGIVLAGSEVFRFMEQNRAAMQGMETGKDGFVRFRRRLDALVDLLAGPDAPLRNRVRATTAVLVRGRDLHLLPAAGRRPGQATGRRPRDRHRPHPLRPGRLRPAPRGPRPYRSGLHPPPPGLLPCSRGGLFRAARVLGSSAPSIRSQAARVCSNKGMASAGRGPPPGMPPRGCSVRPGSWGGRHPATARGWPGSAQAAVSPWRPGLSAGRRRPACSGNAGCWVVRPSSRSRAIRVRWNGGIASVRQASR